jgi:hypothetical protein
MKRKASRKRKPPRAKPAAEIAAAKPAPPDAIGALVSAGAQALGLTLDPAWRAGVRLNLQLILRHGAVVEGFRLPTTPNPRIFFMPELFDA